MHRAVEIRTVDGQVHRGIINRVDQNHVYLSPLSGNQDGFDGGPGLYYWGYGWGFPIALASIAALAAIAFW